MSLTLPTVRLNQTGLYSVVVKNEGGSVESRVAELTVHGRPPNDDFANRIKLSGEGVPP